MFALKLLSEAGPNTELAWLLWVALGFFFLMVVVGWLVSRNRKPAPEVTRAEDNPEHEKEDNLEIIEGIGPKVAKILKAAGITSFDELAHARPDQIETALKAAGLTMMDPAGWIEQAKLAAKGDMDGLKKMQVEMKGGRIK